MASSSHKWIIGIAFGLFGCLVLAAYLWWHSTGAKLIQGVAGSMLDGRRVGRTTVASACIDSTLARHGTALATLPKAGDTSWHGDMAAVIAAPVFLQGCLMAAQPSPELCASVPPRTDRTASREWIEAECKRRQVGGQGCPILMSGVQTYCQQRGRTAS